MPNWCYNYLNFNSMNNEAKKLYDLIITWQKEGTTIENSWNNDWLGLIVEKGLKTDPLSGKYSCRGCIDEIELANDNELMINTHTAWGPMNKMWQDLVDKLGYTMNITCTSEEPNMGVYVTNDPELKDKYVIGYWGDDKDIYSFLENTNDNTEKDLRKLFSVLYQKNKKGFKKILKDKGLTTDKQFKEYLKSNPVDEIINEISDMLDEFIIEKWDYTVDLP